MQPTEAILTSQTQTNKKRSTQNVSDSEIVLIGAAVLSRHLKRLLQTALPGSAKQISCLAHTFNRRRQLAACTGLISRQVSADLQIIGRIRNRVAHSEIPIDFDNHYIGSTLGGLSIYAAARKRKMDKRSVFVVSIYDLGDRLSSRLTSFRK